MRRPWQIWSAFAAGLLLVTAAVGWLSYRALESERAEGIARAQAELEGDVRLVLWRLDSAIAPLIAQENANPVWAYTAMVEPEDSHQVMHRLPQPVPSPLLRNFDRRIKLHFQFNRTGQWSSPEVPSPEEAASLPPGKVNNESVAQDRRRLDELERLIEKQKLVAALDQATRLPNVLLEPVPSGPDRPLSQQTLSSNEFQMRQQVVSSNTVESGLVRGLKWLNSHGKGEALTPLWFDDQLLLVRRAAPDGDLVIQGCWLDWPLIREQLLSTVRDLLPDATLEPARTLDDAQLSRRLAALPVTLAPGQLPAPTAEGLTPLRLSLATTWACLALATLAAAILLRGVLALSERRAAFVSAVTHELRTPLTTFRMYAEMLAEGMVSETDRHHYLETLQTEAGRLSHLVENVLAYARLERGGPTGRIGPVPVGDLLDRASQRLAPRAAAAGFVIECSAPAKVLTLCAVADPAAVEQILFNLVDNACKYAQGAKDRRLWLEATRSNGRVLISVRDEGPGISPFVRKRLFQPFRKSARDAAQSAPGVGLGLALCRRLARDMGGELSLEDQNSAGASFVLTLKAAASPEV